MNDLLNEVLPLTDEGCTAEEAWERRYKSLPEFIEEKVQFDQFKERLKGHREQITKKKLFSAKQMEAFLHHQSLHPCRTHNDRGELIFDMHPAKAKLRQDVKAKRHESMMPAQLHAS